MRLRLRRWWHGSPLPEGRHARVLPVVSVPGAASTLVSRTPAQAAAADADADRAPASPPDGALPPPAAALAASPASPAVDPAPGAAVGLVFADGQRVELGPDDPRVPTFRAAASALLDAPRS